MKREDYEMLHRSTWDRIDYAQRQRWDIGREAYSECDMAFALLGLLAVVLDNVEVDDE